MFTCGILSQKVLRKIIILEHWKKTDYWKLQLHWKASQSTLEASQKGPFTIHVEISLYLDQIIYLTSAGI